MFDEDIEALAKAVVEEAAARHLTIGTAESCTGGLASAALTEISGSSAVVQGGIVSYALSIKEKLLGVGHGTLLEHGAVSAECVREMARGAREALDCDIAVSISGIAGPTGAVPGKPIGTVWFGICAEGFSDEEVCPFIGDRQQVRAQSVKRALELVLDAILRS
jgi:nicotinamide-nucleotide amidase